MRLVTRGALATALALGMLGAGAGVAAADTGDDRIPCNRGEICFSRDYGPTAGYFRYQKHFWYAGNHAGYYWFDTVAKKSTTRAIRNDASALANRDTLCDVKVVNDRGVLPDFTKTIGNNPDKADWKYLQNVNDANDRHERTNCA